MKNNFVRFTRLLLGMIVLLGIAYGCEVLLEFLKARNAVTFDLNYLIIASYAPMMMLVSLAALLLFWDLIVHSYRSLGMGIFYLLVGILIVLAPFLYYTPILGWLQPPFPGVLYPNSPFYFAGALVGMIGLLMIVLPRQRIGEA